MLVGPADLLPAAPDPDDAGFQAAAALVEAVSALEVAGNFMFDAATHRDFLGAVLGTGIERSKVGGWRLTKANAQGRVCMLLPAQHATHYLRLIVTSGGKALLAGTCGNEKQQDCFLSCRWVTSWLWATVARSSWWSHSSQTSSVRR